MKVWLTEHLLKEFPEFHQTASHPKFQYTIVKEPGLKMQPHSRWRYTLALSTVCASPTNHWPAQQLKYMSAIRVIGRTCCRQVIIF